MSKTYESFGLLVTVPDDADASSNGKVEVEPSITKGSFRQFEYDYPSKNKIENSFQEMITETPLDRMKPLAVLDAANIAWNYGNDTFKVEGIIIAVDFFRFKCGIDVKAFLPAYYLKQKPKDGRNGNVMMKTNELEQLELLMADGVLIPVPPTDNDDHYIVSYARDNDGFVVSNDLFRDHIDSIEDAATQKSLLFWLENYRCSYTFVAEGLMINPSSSLSLTINNYKIHQTTHSITFDGNQNAWNSLQIGQIRALRSLSDTIAQFGQLKELKFLLLARASLLIEVK